MSVRRDEVVGVVVLATGVVVDGGVASGGSVCAVANDVVGATAGDSVARGGGAASGCDDGFVNMLGHCAVGRGAVGGECEKSGAAGRAYVGSWGGRPECEVGRKAYPVYSCAGDCVCGEW